MKIQIDNKTYELGKEQEIALLNQVAAMALEEYGKLDPAFRIAAKGIARQLLLKTEDKARAQHGKEVSLYFRPEKGTDPVEHFIRAMGVPFTMEALKNAKITATTADNTITAIGFSVKGESQSG